MEFVIILLVLAGVAITIGVIWYIQRQRYIQAFESLGWTFVNTPSIEIAHGLNMPPFGLGFDRRVDEQVIGTTSRGVPFQAFEYKASNYSLGGFVVAMPLGHSMPEYHLVPTPRERNGSMTLIVQESPTHRTLSTVPEFGHAVDSVIGPLLGGFPAGTVVDLSIDHDQLVAHGAPTDAAGLQPFVEALGPIATALNAAPLSSFVGPERPVELGWYNRPDWIYRVRDDGMLQSVNHTGGGSNHEATNVIFCNTAPLPFVRLTHKWTTTRTVTESDGDGGTRTRTVTDHHSEEIFEYHPTFPFRDFKVNAGWFGGRRTFESEDFNEQFTVRASDPRFAHDIFHPRMMEYLMATRPAPFVHDGQGRLTIDLSGNTASIEAATDFLLGFFARVPNYVWENLGLFTPPLPLYHAVDEGVRTALEQVQQQRMPYRQ
ncbi:hypothetical protein [Aestuariimicrobium ganziense]|uniref:hypothetical protein n=1 Tax=Aestuariimicrobium ganziense TaxID=2773677 RepID=UPI001943BB44|nr:hypothetical protein [Aestuariimicrobium ganziense]